MNGRFPKGGNDRFDKRALLAVAGVAGAALLLAAALTEQTGETQMWVPLNEAVAESLAEHGFSEAKTVAIEAEGENGAETVEKAGGANGGPEGETNGESTTSGDGADGNIEVSGSGETGGQANEGIGANGTVSIDDFANTGLIDVNRATAAELQALKGIGPAKAQAIVDDRKLRGFFDSVDDLIRVKGIGEKLLAGIKESVVARP